MSGRRALLFVLALGAVAALQASCVSAFGVDESSLHDAIHDMCGCPLLDGVETCEATLTARMNGASTTVQSAWLARYVEKCTDCPNVLQCMSESPTCSKDKCKRDEECCTVTGPGKAKCVLQHCKQPT